MKPEKLLNIIGEIDMKYIVSARRKLEASGVDNNKDFEQQVYQRTAFCLAGVLIAMALVLFLAMGFSELVFGVLLTIGNCIN